jgi:transposase-like protein
VARYGKEYKDRVVARLLPPESAAVERVSAEVGVSASTLERWLAEALESTSGGASNGAQRRLDVRTLQRWRARTGTGDGRPGAVRPMPAHALSQDERTRLLEVTGRWFSCT